jgi:hypothetical protein
MEHTKLILGGHNKKTEVGNFAVITDGEGMPPVAYVAYDDTAKFIVTAYNNHEQLLDTCKQALDCLCAMTTQDFSMGKDKPIRHLLAEAIAKAEAK